jgi:hypothetical protein
MRTLFVASVTDSVTVPAASVNLVDPPAEAALSVNDVPDVDPLSAAIVTELDGGACHVGREVAPVDVSMLPAVLMPVVACCTELVAEVPPITGAYGVIEDIPVPPDPTKRPPPKLKVVPVTLVERPELPPEILNAELVDDPVSPDMTGVVIPAISVASAFSAASARVVSVVTAVLIVLSALVALLTSLAKLPLIMLSAASARATSAETEA